MELVFLGTGAGVPTKKRNVSAIALSLLNEKGAVWLFDCGEGTQQQWLQTPLKLSRLEKIFITHLHGDHLFGLPGLLSSRSFQEGEKPLDLYGPPGIRHYIETVFHLAQTKLRYPLNIYEFSDGQTIVDEKEWRITVFRLKHVVPSFGFRIVEKDRPGALNVAKLKARNIPPGPIYREIKEGKKVRLPSGELIHGRDFLGSPKRGRKIAILGDTAPTPKATVLASGVDVLVHEATFRADVRCKAHRYFHSTTADAARVAKEADCGMLLLTHISPRYDGEEEDFLKEARAFFPNTHLAEDLQTVVVQRRG